MRRAAATSGSGRSSAAENSASIRSGTGGSAPGGAGAVAGAPGGDGGGAPPAIASSAGPIRSFPSTVPGWAAAPRSTDAAAVSAIQDPSAGAPRGSSLPRPSRSRTAAVHPSALSGPRAVVIAPACRIHGARSRKRT